MPVFRVEKNSNYTTMCNYHLRDQGLSLKGKGLLELPQFIRTAQKSPYVGNIILSGVAQR